MGQVLHGSATTTEAVRRAMQNSQESLRTRSERYGINQKTVAKWRKRTLVSNMPRGPKKTGFVRTVDRGGGGYCRLPASHAATPRRLSLLAATNHPASHTIFIASLPSAPRHLKVARGAGR